MDRRVDRRVEQVQRRPLLRPGAVHHRARVWLGQLVRVILPQKPPPHTPDMDYIWPGGEKFRLGLCSDLHFGSTKHQNGALRHFAQTAADLEVKHILISGDVTAGYKVYEGQELNSTLTARTSRWTPPVRACPRSGAWSGSRKAATTTPSTTIVEAPTWCAASATRATTVLTYLLNKLG